MKKVLFLAAIAAVAMTGCSNDETISEQQATKGNAVEFRATVNNGVEATRATTIDLDNLKDFRVTAAYYDTYTTASAYLMSGIPVVRAAGGANTFTYAPIVYYSPNIEAGDHFHFFAFSPAGSPNVTAGTPAMTNTVVAADAATAVLSYTVPLKDADGDAKQEDFLVARNASDGASATAVAFTFDHALAKVTFSVKNSAPGTTVTVNSVKLVNMDNTGTLTMSADLVAAPPTSSIAWSMNTTYDQTYEMAIPTGGFAVLGNNAAYAAQTTINEGLMVLPQALAAWTGGAVAGDEPAATGEAYIEIKYKVTDGAGTEIVPEDDYQFKFGGLTSLDYGHTYELQLQYSGFGVAFAVTNVNGWQAVAGQPIN
ncbi:MAG: fimbrillin family protein [Prevotellaceae bacterium]|jgi:hypothetical protein|nr:fimbrillin family protein [Prevotellaceae bacterium]